MPGECGRLLDRPGVARIVVTRGVGVIACIIAAVTVCAVVVRAVVALVAIVAFIVVAAVVVFPRELLLY